MNIYGVKDVAVNAFHMPMFFQSDKACVRALGDAVNTPKEDNIYYKHPEHFDLYKIGVFDEETGVIAGHAPEFIVGCDSLVRS